MTLKGKRTSYGLVEIREERGSYGIYVNGSLKESSSDLNYILSSPPSECQYQFNVQFQYQHKIQSTHHCYETKGMR